MLDEMCAETRNWFTRDVDKHGGNYEIKNGDISPSDFLQSGMYFRIRGSAMNDGVYQYPCPSLTDETFDGAIWVMKIPPAFIKLHDEIETYCKKNADTTPYTSESFGGYSYSVATASNGAPQSWREVFASRLNVWRKM